MIGFVYAIGDGEGRVKIGWSRNPVSRLHQVRVHCAGRPALLGLAPGTMEQEAEAHRLLDRWHVTGEWFRLEGAVQAFVDMLPRPRPELVRDNGHPLQSYRRRERISLHVLAARLGISHGSLSRIENGKQQITVDGDDPLLPKLVAETGIPAEMLRPDLAKLFDYEAAA